MLDNNMVLSRFCYWAQTMHIPRGVKSAIESDVHALIWNKDCLFEGDETGTEPKNRAWVCQGVCNFLSNRVNDVIDHKQDKK